MKGRVVRLASASSFSADTSQAAHSRAACAVAPRARAQEDLGTEHREVGVLLAPSRRILASFPSTFPPFLHEPPRHERERRD